MNPTYDYSNVTVPLALFGWIPVALLLFAVLPPQRAVIVGFLGAWMFLPVAGYKIPGLLEYSKVTATSIGIFLGAACFNARGLLAFRPSLLDVPIAVWCLCPFVSSLTNGLGAYDGLSTVSQTTITWGLPYYLARVSFKSAADLRELAWWLVIGGLIYVPLCWFEIRMSPHLHRWVYGFGGGGTRYAAELGKWGNQAYVFMGNGLALSMFMTTASLCGFCLWSSGSLKRLWGCSAGWLVFILTCTTLACKNMGAASLLVFGLVTFWTVKRFQTRLTVCLLILVTPLYIVLRTTGTWSGESLVRLSSEIHKERGASLQFRLDNEDMLIAKALQQPVFGWGGWGRARVYGEAWEGGEIRDLSITDGLWIIALGNTGITGLAAVTCVFLVPAAFAARRYSAKAWRDPAVAPVAALLVLLALYAIDNLFNAMINPIYIVTAGGLTSLVSTPSTTFRGSRQQLFSPRHVSQESVVRLAAHWRRVPAHGPPRCRQDRGGPAD